MDNIQMEAFNIVGISCRTSNLNYQAADDITKLWETFQSQSIFNSIKDKIDQNIYVVYTDYEGDHNAPYTVLLGCKVENLDQVSDSLQGKSFKKANYIRFSPKGRLPEIVIEQWLKIWNSDISRAYTADLEIYGERSTDPENAEVDILIAV
jgi:predicted transcriptional regulator YdeE